MKKIADAIAEELKKYDGLGSSCPTLLDTVPKRHTLWDGIRDFWRFAMIGEA